MDERAVVSFTQKKLSLPLRLGKKIMFFIIIFLWEKITKKFQCHNILWHGVTFYQNSRKIP